VVTGAIQTWIVMSPIISPHKYDKSYYYFNLFVR
jgi:hypothetical protein